MRSTLLTFYSNHSRDKKNKYFPQESPKKPRQKMPTIYRHKLYDKPYLFNPKYNSYLQNPQLGLNTTQSIRKTRLDRHVQRERNQMVMKTGRNSVDNPDWLKNTLPYYQRDHCIYSQRQSVNQEKNYDIFNRRKNKNTFDTRRNEDSYYGRMAKQQLSRSQQLKDTSKLGERIERKMRSTLQWRQQCQRQISPKVGSLETRNYNIPKPLLKVGKKDYVDTYSPF